MRHDTLGSLLREGRAAFAGGPGGASSREAGLLLGHVLGLGEASVLARSEQEVEPAAAARFRDLVERRREGEPIAYLVGEREFYGRPFFVDPRVLIPRPESEHLVEAALALDLPARPRILDLGTGSGCLAVTLALELAGARVVASDLSLDALRVARSNVARHRVGRRVAAVRADLTSALRLERFDLVVSNPPYVDAEDPSTAAEVRAFEPALALYAADSGRSVVAALLEVAPALRPGVHLLLEIGYDQSDWLRSAAAERTQLELVDVVRDYGGIPRTAVIQRQRRS